MTRVATFWTFDLFRSIACLAALGLLAGAAPTAWAQDGADAAASDEAVPDVVPQQESVTIEPYTGPPIFLPEPASPPPAIRVKDETVTDYYDPETKENPRVSRTVRYFSDDTVKSEGAYKEYYENGQVFSEGAYSDGVPVGEWKFYHPDGQLSKTVNYAEGRPEGVIEVRRADGTMQARREYADGKRNGDWIVYGDDGKQMLLESHYQQGLPAGLWQAWFPDGQKWRELSFVDGKQQGLVTEWDKEGTKRAEVNFEQGLRQGVSRLWTADGRQFEQTYEDGRLVSTKEVEQ